jgi:hypothetical protein
MVMTFHPSKQMFQNNTFTNLVDKIELCPLENLCDGCQEFIEKINIKRLTEFVKNKDFSRDCSSIRVVIPFSKRTTEFFTNNGILKLLKSLSEEIVNYAGYFKKYRGLMLVSPILKGEKKEPFLCIDIIIRPYLADDVYEMISEKVEKMKELNKDFDVELMSYTDGIIDDDRFTDNEILTYDLYPEFIEILKNKNPEFDVNELERILIWGSYNITFNGDFWTSIMIEINNKKGEKEI